MRQTLLNRAAAILVVLICGVAIRGALSAAEPAGAPRPVRILLIGDSTVASYPKPPADRPDLTGWGQVFGEFFTDNVAILNHARSGASSKSFFQLGLWSKAIAERPDYVFIQFGHNDGPGKGDRSTDPKTEFRDNLRRYIDETRAAGAKPVLVTPVSRRTFKEGKIETTLEPEQLLDACKALEQELGREDGGPRHGPRSIDVDVLLLGELTHSSQRLALPHPQVLSRRFVLIPLLELDFELSTPSGERLSDALLALPFAEGVRLAGPPLRRAA